MRFGQKMLLAAAGMAIWTPCVTEALDGNDVGIYGNAWADYVLEHPRDFDFFIYQARLLNAPEGEIPDKVKAFKAAGVPVVLDMQFYANSAQRGMREGAPPMKDLRYYEDLFATVLDHVSRDAVPLITIEEENVHWDGRAEFLSDLYKAVKARFPERSFYQWYSPRLQPSIAIPGETWPDLPADGWVIDQYAVYGDKFASYITSVKRLNKPLLAVMWAVPQWRVADQSRRLDTEWWDKKGWKIFYSQLATYRKYDVPIALYAAAPRAEGDASNVALYQSDNDCDRKFFAALLAVTLPALRSDQRVAAEIPRQKPSWIPGHCG